MLHLKNVKYSAFASHETHCYQADLYFHKLKVAQVGNDGRGGCDDQHWNCGKVDVDNYITALNTFATDAEKADEIRRRIGRLVDIGDDGYCKNDTQHSDEILLADYSDVLEISWMKPDLESICCHLVNDHLAKKDLKRLLSKRVLWTKPNENGVYQTQTTNAVTRNKWVSEIAGYPDTDQCLNTMPFDAALALFQERT